MGRCRALLVSSCLLGLCTRYDGESRPSMEVVELVDFRTLIPVCPEQLGGLPTPRPPADIVGGDGFDVLAGRAKLFTRHDNINVTSAFLRGAYECLRIARLFSVEGCIMKSGSPSCGVAGVTGVASAMLLEAGFHVRESAA